MNQPQNFAQATDLAGRAIRATNFLLDHWYVWLILVALAVVLWMWRSQHQLIGQLEERADAAYGDVDALLVERKGLIGNLVEVVRAFANREQSVIRDVLDGRVAALEALTSGDNAGITNNQMAGVLQNLFTVSENYPELHSSEHYRQLRTDLIRTEEKITAARRFYNLCVEELNGVKRAFPGNLIGRNSGEPREKFSLGERRADFAEPISISL
ncbi:MULTISPECIES: LemA family protein [Sphingomonas]|uniref:LemA family protein n=1 Tax=Sphingomonas TaxID=13687 RepID=UPI000DEFA1FB|nr:MULTISPECIES: LemA family protein [Sphingomonas]